MMISVLIAGADAGRRARLASPLISQGYYIIEAESGLRAIELLKRRRNIALALMDAEMADMANMDFMADIRAAGLQTPIIIMAGSEEDERLRRALASGADDFLIYPISAERLCLSAGNLLQKNMLRQNIRQQTGLRQERTPALSEWVSDSEVMQNLLAKARASAGTNPVILICGEEGAGKAALARAVYAETHRHKAADKQAQAAAERGGGGADAAAAAESADAPSASAAAPFIYIGCGHKGQGSASGLPSDAALAAAAARAGGGVLCFGNIDALGKTEQARFLSFIEHMQEQGRLSARRGEARAGAAEAGKAARPFQLIATAAAHIQDLVAEGSLSSGLYKRLSACVLNIPPLRERREDIAAIADFLLARLIAESGNVKLGGLSGAAQALLTHYDWPGNIRELENILYRAVRLSDGRLLTPRDFPQLTEAEGEAANPAPRHALQPDMFYEADGHIKPLAEIEKQAVLEAMKRYRSKISEVARRLKIGRSTLYRKLEEYGLFPEKD